MKHSHLVRRIRTSLCALTLCASMAVADSVPSLGEAGLSSGSYCCMHMMLEKTFLKVDVATIDMKVGSSTRDSFKQVLGGKPPSDAALNRLAKVAIGADRAVIQLKFVRSVSLDQWIGGVRDSLEAAEKEGLITSSLRKQVSDGLPIWFQPVAARGYKDGDRVLYRISGDELRTVAVTKEGKVMVDRKDTGKDKTHLVLASYFAKDTDYRDLLLKSLRP